MFFLALIILTCTLLAYATIWALSLITGRIAVASRICLFAWVICCIVSYQLLIDVQGDGWRLHNLMSSPYFRYGGNSWEWHGETWRMANFPHINGVLIGAVVGLTACVIPIIRLRQAHEFEMTGFQFAMLNFTWIVLLFLFKQNTVYGLLLMTAVMLPILLLLQLWVSLSE